VSLSSQPTFHNSAFACRVTRARVRNNIDAGLCAASCCVAVARASTPMVTGVSCDVSAASSAASARTLHRHIKVSEWKSSPSRLTWHVQRR
jgi:hypothetical protein